MLVSHSRRSFLSTLWLSAGILAFVAACKCPPTAPSGPASRGASAGGAGGGGAGPMTVHGRANFYSPTTANLDVKVHENERPFKAHHMDIWWDSHTGTPTYSALPNVSFNKLDTTQPTWLIEGLVCAIVAGDTHFRVKVIVYDKLGNRVTNPYREFEWRIPSGEPFPIWQELVYPLN